MLICDRSLPMFLHNKFHRDRPSVSGLGAGNVVRRPVRPWEGPPLEINASQVIFDGLVP